MTNDIKRLFIIKILGELLKNFNMVIVPIKNDVENIRMYYDFSQDLVTEYIVTFKDLMDFCDLNSLYYYYDSLDYNQLYKELMKSKYFNENIFQKANDLIIGLKNVEIIEAVRGFMNSIIDTHDSYKNHYIFTKNSTMHMKAFDYFFGTNFEKDVQELLQSKYNEVLSFEEAKKIIKRVDNKVSDKDVVSTIDLIKYEAKEYGGIKSYLSVLDTEDIVIDIVETYKQYTAK